MLAISFMYIYVTAIWDKTKLTYAYLSRFLLYFVKALKVAERESFIESGDAQVECSSYIWILILSTKVYVHTILDYMRNSLDYSRGILEFLMHSSDRFGPFADEIRR